VSDNCRLAKLASGYWLLAAAEGCPTFMPPSLPASQLQAYELSAMSYLPGT